MAVYRRTNRRRSVLALLVLTSVTLITLDARGNGSRLIGSARGTARDATEPVVRAVDDAVTPIGDWFDGVLHSGDLERQNASLRRQLAEARGRAAQARAALRENAELKRLAGIPFVGSTPTVTAQVVGSSPGNFETTLTIDKGSRAGIAVGMPVVGGEGLVGRIIEVSSRQATVGLVTDPQSGVAVRLERSAAYAIAKGSEGHTDLSLQAVPADVAVAKGELVSTAGLQNGAYPAGIPVARVVSVHKAPGDLEQSITVRPLVDLGRLAYVRVLRWPTAGTGG